MTLDELLAMPIGSYEQPTERLLCTRVPGGWIYENVYGLSFVPEPPAPAAETTTISTERTFTLPEMKQAYSTAYKTGIDSPASFLRPEQLHKRMKIDFKQQFNVEI